MGRFKVLYSEPIDETSDAQVGIAYQWATDDNPEPMAVRYRYNDRTGGTSRMSPTFPIGVLPHMVSALAHYRQ